MENNSKYKLKEFSSSDALHAAAAEFVLKAAEESIAVRGRFCLSLSGGKTPQKLFTLLADKPYRTQIDWQKTFVFWGDERCVPLDDAQNNAYQARLILLDNVDIPPNNVFRIQTDLSPQIAATDYEKSINAFFQNQTPRFDLILLGLGGDGHTASIFPQTAVVHEQAIGVREVYKQDEDMYRITMTAPLINLARQILFLAEGESKAEILYKVLTGVYQPSFYPAQLIQPSNGTLNFFVDSLAAAYIK